MRNCSRFKAPVAATILSATILFAQAVTSTITGRLSDPTGAVIPGAKVTVVNQNSGVKYEGQSNEVGLYRIGPLSPGAYRVEVEAPAFQRLVRQGITVQVSETVTVDLTLQVGNVSETVTVTGAAAIIESQSSSVGQLVERSMIESMPLPNRSAAAMIVLSPGAAVINPGSGGETLPIFAVGGGRARNQQFSLDGGNVTNITGLAVPQNQAALPMDAMQEFRVISNNYAAEHGHSTGGVITMATKAGTNEFHGSLFEYARNDAFDARNFYSATKPMLRLHQFGGSAGGPIRKDKTHFFASWEQTRQVTGGPAIQTVPDPVQRQGDFSHTTNAAGVLIPIFDPATTAGGVRQPFPENRIPADRIDAVARAVTAYWPLPNRAASITGANNYIGNTRPDFARNIVVARVDHQFRPSDQVMVRYYINDNDTENFGPRGMPESDPGAVKTSNQNSSILASHTHMFSARAVQEFRFARLRRFGGSQAYGRGKDYADKLGLNGVSNEAFPIFNIPGFAGLGREPFRINSAPQHDDQYQDSVSYYRGDHAFKFGAEYRRGSFNDNHDVSSSGSFSFTPLITGQPGVASSGNALASFLLGEVNAASTVRADEIMRRRLFVPTRLIPVPATGRCMRRTTTGSTIASP
ncbi:MAG: carboxypeptidase-like regulatory domain-containing protein [Acidobacteria bacterium]|nr:carboxypeptidase-like regulatory domain-containing protein [Acidobacteriota bacterium]